MLPNSLNKPTEYKQMKDANNFLQENDDDNNLLDDGVDDEYDNTDVEYTDEPGYVTSLPNKTYEYRALDTLTKNMGDVTDIDNLVICPYSVNTEGVAPFLQFGLINDGLSLNFINVHCSQLTELEKLTSFRGHLVQNRTLYFFFEYREDNAGLFLLLFPVQSFVLVDEIMNHRMVCQTPISIDVLDFFKTNNQFLYLASERDYVYETPVVGYHGTYGNNLKFVSMFGVCTSKNEEIMGPYYYFTDYINAFRQGIIPRKEHLKNEKYEQYLTADNKYKDGCVVRFAIFLGKSHVPLNRPSDPIDESQMKKQLLNAVETSKQAKLTMRISDHDGKWTECYDSVYVGKLDLDDGSVLMNAPLWVLKDFNQQVFLDFYKIPNK
jgi:hypothetical protein